MDGSGNEWQQDGVGVGSRSWVGVGSRSWGGGQVVVSSEMVEAVEKDGCYTGRGGKMVVEVVIVDKDSHHWEKY